MSHLDPDCRLTPCFPDKLKVCREPADAATAPAVTPAAAPAATPAATPLQGLKMASHAVLEAAQRRGRMKCSKCGGSRMFFCYTCCSLVGVSPQEVPVIKLPVKVVIIKHPNETDGKSTAIHAKILAPDDVSIYTFPCIPEFDKDSTVLVFPGPDSVSVEDVLQRLLDRKSRDPHEPRTKRIKAEGGRDATPASGNAEAESGASGGAGSSAAEGLVLQRAVFIDSTWNQTNKISTDERLQGLVQVELKTRKTCFWRRQKGKPDSYLATIEAIYYFLQDFHRHGLAREYGGEYDNLLFFYTFLHSVVNEAKRLAGKI